MISKIKRYFLDFEAEVASSEPAYFRRRLHWLPFIFFVAGFFPLALSVFRLLPLNICEEIHDHLGIIYILILSLLLSVWIEQAFFTPDLPKILSTRTFPIMAMVFLIIDTIGGLGFSLEFDLLALIFSSHLYISWTLSLLSVVVVQKERKALVYSWGLSLVHFPIMLASATGIALAAFEAISTLPVLLIEQIRQPLGSPVFPLLSSLASILALFLVCRWLTNYVKDEKGTTLNRSDALTRQILLMTLLPLFFAILTTSIISFVVLLLGMPNISSYLFFLTSVVCLVACDLSNRQQLLDIVGRPT